MSSTTKKTISTSLFEDEIEALDRVRERQQLSRAEAVREAVRWYISAMHSLPPTEDPLPDEVEAIDRGQQQIARGEYTLLEDLKHEMDRPPES
ncbi:MAG: ribbon-helix-helix protein, CopG family [Stellaceae bacterium]|jgi:cell division protein FtsX